jgi:hypothetical protein
MMKRLSITAWTGLALLALAGCSGAVREELQQWLRVPRGQVRP